MPESDRPRNSVNANCSEHVVCVNGREVADGGVERGVGGQKVRLIDNAYGQLRRWMCVWDVPQQHGKGTERQRKHARPAHGSGSAALEPVCAVHPLFSSRLPFRRLPGRRRPAAPGRSHRGRPGRSAGGQGEGAGSGEGWPSWGSDSAFVCEIGIFRP